MGTIVTFNYDIWVTQFPEFANVSDASVVGVPYTDPVTGFVYDPVGYLSIAQRYVRNDGGGPVRDPNVQLQLLNLMVSHVVWLDCPQVNGYPNNTAASGQVPAPNVVGRINNASEGTVSVATEWPEALSAGETFFTQTRYGAQFLRMIAPYRTARYIPGPRRYFGPVYGGGGAPFGNVWGGYWN